MLVKLDDRLKAVADLVLPGKTAADIGTDPIITCRFSCPNNICEHVIASDRADGPYRNAASLVKRLALEDKNKDSSRRGVRGIKSRRSGDNNNSRYGRTVDD